MLSTGFNLIDNAHVPHNKRPHQCEARLQMTVEKSRFNGAAVVILYETIKTVRGDVTRQIWANLTRADVELLRTYLAD